VVIRGASILEPGERVLLLELARCALEARVRGQRVPVAPRGGALDLAQAVFVSLHGEGLLRGGLGRLQGDAPLGRAGSDLAGAVADADPRFPPVREDELPGLVIEISVLTDARPVAGVDAIEVCRHGVIVAAGSRQGLLLPQVAVELGWDRARLLEHACLKAGLRRNAWQRGAQILVFEADVFGEAPRPGAG
jgi:AmmeMemoRadiSam system protein A